MARKLKTYQTSLGFYELAVAAPSMKAAIEAWGADPDIFRLGFARQTDDPAIVQAAMASPGNVLRRSAGSDGKFTQNARLPEIPPDDGPDSRSKQRKSKPKSSKSKPNRQIDEKLTIEKRQRDLESRKAEAEQRRAEKKSERILAAANAAFERAEARHRKAVTALEQRRSKLDHDLRIENERWESEQRHHQDSLTRMDRKKT